MIIATREAVKWPRSQRDLIAPRGWQRLLRGISPTIIARRASGSSEPETEFQTEALPQLG
jgi:hypothetical protein